MSETIHLGLHDVLTYTVDGPTLVHITTEPEGAVGHATVEAQTVAGLRKRIRDLESLVASLQSRLSDAQEELDARDSDVLRG